MKNEIKASLQGTDGDIILDGSNNIADNVLCSRTLDSPDTDVKKHYEEKLKMYTIVEELQKKYYQKFAEIFKKKYPHGISLINWSSHGEITGVDYDNDEWRNYQSTSGSFGAHDGVAFVDQEMLKYYEPYHLVAHEIGHTLFLEHWKNTTPIVEAHDKEDDNCIMSYLPLIHDFEVSIKKPRSGFQKADIKVKAINAIGSGLKFYDSNLTIEVQTTTAEPGWNQSQNVANNRGIYKFSNRDFNKKSVGNYLPAKGSLKITSPDGISKTIEWQSDDNGRSDYKDKVWKTSAPLMPPSDLGPVIARGNAAHYRTGSYKPHFCGKCNLKLRGWDISAGVLPEDST